MVVGERLLDVGGFRRADRRELERNASIHDLARGPVPEDAAGKQLCGGDPSPIADQDVRLNCDDGRAVDLTFGPQLDAVATASRTQ